MARIMPFPVIHIGFTGTRRGMTDVQKESLKRLLTVGWLKHAMFHHGDCVGADEQATHVAATAGYMIVSHPPSDARHRAFTERTTAAHGRITVQPPKPYLERNRDIVDASMVLLAAPGETSEVLRSGTWSTIRYARRTHKYTVVISPEGSIATEAVHNFLIMMDFHCRMQELRLELDEKIRNHNFVHMALRFDVAQGA